MTVGWDGLAVHEAVKSAVALRLRSTDPRKHLRLRRAAWRQLQAESVESGTRGQWRYTSDMMYLLLEQPILREGFFPSTESAIVVDPATPADIPAIRAIELARCGPEAAAILDYWLKWQLDAFGVARNREGAIVGFKCATTSDRLDPRLADVDPVVASWLADVAASPAPNEPAFMLRRWQSRDEGEAHGDAQAACWIDCKRDYMARRPYLGHVYVCSTQTDFYLPFLAALGFARVPGSDVRLDGQLHRTVASRLGVGSVDGWLTRLVAAELGVDASTLLDEMGRRLVIGGTHVPLTPLEFGVMRCLVRRQGEAVSRAELVEDVWGHKYSGESNVEGVVIRGLRAKLGSRASMIETVRGYGYRLRDDLPANGPAPA